MKASSLALLLLLLAGCSSSAARIAPVPEQAPIVVHPVRNLAGVPITLPELWLGDAGDAAAGIKLDTVDMRLLVEAALVAGMTSAGHSISPDAPYQLHAAVTRFELLELRSTGRVVLGVVVIVVDAQGNELAQGNAELEYQLMEIAPDEGGAVGEERFIRARLETLAEAATRAALLDAGL